MIRSMLGRYGQVPLLGLVATVILAAVPASARHDLQRFALRSSAAVPHDRAPCPFQTVKG